MNIFKNFTYKLLALVSAVAFWFFLMLFQNVIYDMASPLPIEVRHKPDGFEIVQEIPEINLRVTAPKDEVSFLRSEDFDVYLDVRELSEEDGMVDIHVETSRKNVNVVSYVPSRIPITLESIQTEVFPVVGVVKGQPATGFVAESLSYRATDVRVTGPETLLEQVKYVKFEVELKGRETDTVIGAYSLSAYDENHEKIEHGIEIQPQEVDATLEVKKLALRKTVPVRADFAEDVDTSRIADIIIEPYEVVVTGPDIEISRVENIQTVEIDRELVRSLLVGTRNKVRLIVPEGLEVIGEPIVEIKLK